MKYLIELEAKKGEDPIYFTDAYIDDAREVDYAIHKIATKLNKADSVVLYLSTKDEPIEIRELIVNGNMRERMHKTVEEFKERVKEVSL